MQSEKRLGNHYSMIDDEEYYILGLPIQTRIGYCHFLKVKELPTLQQKLQIIALTKQHYINSVKENAKNNSETIEAFSELSLWQIISQFPEVLETYSHVFSEFFRDEEALSKIQDEKEFEYYRDLILKLSCIQEEEVNPNPEIQRAIDRSKRVKAQEGGQVDLASIMSSVSVIKGVGYKELGEQTLYQLYMDYYRIIQKINYDTGTLFATVSPEQIEIEEWSKPVDLFETDKHGLTRSEFSKVAGVLDG